MKRLIAIVTILVFSIFQISVYEKSRERNEEIQRQQVDAANKVLKDLYIPFLGEVCSCTSPETCTCKAGCQCKEKCGCLKKCPGKER